jgi:hypothetical protein
MPRIPSNVGNRNSAKRTAWYQILRTSVSFLNQRGVTASGLQSNFRNVLRPAANQQASGIVQALSDYADTQGVARGAGPMTISRASSIMSGIQSAAIAEAELEASMVPLAPLAPLAPLSQVPGISPLQSAIFNTPQAGFQTQPSFSGPGFPLGGVGPGAGGRVWTEEGGAGVVGYPAQGAYSAQALSIVVQEKARDIQQELDNMLEYGELLQVGVDTPTPGKLDSCRKVRQEAGYLDSLLVRGTAQKTCTMWVHAKVNGNDNWDDTAAGTDITGLIGKPYKLIIPEDGYLVIPIGIEGTVVINLQVDDASISCASSRFKTRAHMLSSGGGHFAALAANI